MSEYTPEQKLDAIQGTLASPIEEAVAISTAWVLASERIMSEFPNSDEVAPELKEFMLDVSNTAISLLPGGK